MTARVLSSAFANTDIAQFVETFTKPYLAMLAAMTISTKDKSVPAPKVGIGHGQDAAAAAVLRGMPPGRDGPSPSSPTAATATAAAAAPPKFSGHPPSPATGKVNLQNKLLHNKEALVEAVAKFLLGPHCFDQKLLSCTFYGHIQSCLRHDQAMPPLSWNFFFFFPLALGVMIINII